MGKGKGKQRIEIKRILDKSRRRVTFSKRRQGLFKKTEQLDILCGSQTAIVSVSDSGNVFTAGSPSLLRQRLFLLGAGAGIEHHMAGLETMGTEELGRELAAIKDIQRSVEFAMEKKKKKEAAGAGAAVSDCLLPGLVSVDQVAETPPPPGDTATSLGTGVGYGGGEDCSGESPWLGDIEFDEGLFFDVADFLYNDDFDADAVAVAGTTTDPYHYFGF